MQHFKTNPFSTWGSISTLLRDDIFGAGDAGIFAEGGLTLTGTAAFDHGVSVEVSIGADLYAGGGTLGWDAFPTVKITTDRVTLTLGDVEYAAIDMFNMLDGMSFGDYPDENTLRERDSESVARLDASFGDINVAVSIDAFGAVHPSNAISLGVSGKFGAISFTAMYDQAELFDADSNDTTAMVSTPGNVYGVSVGAELGAFTVDLSYMSEDAFIPENSLGVAVGTKVGDFDLAAYYAMNNEGPDAYGASAKGSFGAIGVSVYWDATTAGIHQVSAASSNFGIDVDYAINDEITAYVGYDQGDSFYVGAIMDIAEGASIGVSYADDAGTALARDVDHGSEDFQDGIAVWFSAEF